MTLVGCVPHQLKLLEPKRAAAERSETKSASSDPKSVRLFESRPALQQQRSTLPDSKVSMAASCTSSPLRSHELDYHFASSNSTRLLPRDRSSRLCCPVFHVSLPIALAAHASRPVLTATSQRHPRFPLATWLTTSIFLLLLGPAQPSQLRTNKADTQGTAGTRPATPASAATRL